MKDKVEEQQLTVEYEKLGDIKKCPFLNNQANKAINNEQIETNIKESVIHENKLADNQPVKRLCFVEINHQASYINLLAYYMVQFSYVCFFTFIDVMQPHLLEKKQYISDVPEDQVGSINGDILLYDTLYLVFYL